MPEKRDRKLELALYLCDVAVAVLSLCLAGFWRYGNWATFNQHIELEAALFVLIIVMFVAYYAMDMYTTYIQRSLVREAFFVVLYNVYVLVGMSVYTFTTKNAFDLSRLTLFYFLIINTVLDMFVHAGLKKPFRQIIARGARERRLLVIASPDEAEKVCAKLRQDAEWPYEIAGIEQPGDAIAYAVSHVVDEVLILPEKARTAEETLGVIRDFETMGIPVNLRIETLETGVPDIKTIDHMGGIHVIKFSRRLFDSRMLFIKRLMDIVGGLVGSLLCCVIAIFVAPAIYIESPGPILFAQQRVGRNGRTFTIYKFRSMRVNAEAEKAALMEQNKMDGPIFKVPEDPRITKVGRFLRASSLDEFPQFFNIVRGDMSLVGTRPPTVAEYNQYTPQQKRRLSFRPGLTGLWQVSGRNEITDFDEIVRLDTEYIDRWSIALDVELLLKTFSAVFRRRGAL